MISSVLEEETHLTSVAETGGNVQSSVALVIRSAGADSIENQELCGHHTAGQNALVYG